MPDEMNNAPLQLKRFQVHNLFGSLNHDISFPSPTGNVSEPALVILHGRNGIGKTTILKMLDGLLRLDFDIFRRVPFGEASLTFTSGKKITVKAIRDTQPLSTSLMLITTL